MAVSVSPAWLILVVYGQIAVLWDGRKGTCGFPDFRIIIRLENAFAAAP
jgi:hypothetical protein